MAAPRMQARERPGRGAKRMAVHSLISCPRTKPLWGEIDGERQGPTSSGTGLRLERFDGCGAEPTTTTGWTGAGESGHEWVRIVFAHDLVSTRDRAEACGTGAGTSAARQQSLDLGPTMTRARIARFRHPGIPARRQDAWLVGRRGIWTVRPANAHGHK